MNRAMVLGLVLSWAGSASAQDAATTWSRDGVIAQVLVNPHGDADGVLLRDGTLVRFPPHTVADASSLRIGEQVHADGEAATTPNGVTLFDAQIRAGTRVLVADREPGTEDRGPPRPLQPLTASGRVRLLLTNPEGVVDGFLLEDGTVVHAGPRARLAQLGVAVGATVTVSGPGGTYPQGRSLRAETLRIASGPVMQLGPTPRPRPRP